MGTIVKFKTWFLEKTEEKYSLFKRRQEKNRRQKEEIDFEKENIEKQINDQIKVV